MADPQFIRLDMFPSTVTCPDGTKLRTVRTVVTDTELYVFQDASPQPISVVVEPLYDHSALSRTAHKVTSDETRGEYLIERQSGCGCGNKLKGFRPFPGVPLVRPKTP